MQSVVCEQGTEDPLESQKQDFKFRFKNATVVIEPPKTLEPEQEPEPEPEPEPLDDEERVSEENSSHLAEPPTHLLPASPTKVHGSLLPPTSTPRQGLSREPIVPSMHDVSLLYLSFRLC